VEKTLGCGRPAFLLDYPPSQAALARVRPGDPPVAERFELYVRGVELANGYHELLDPREQSRRFLEANEKRKASGKEALPLDERFLRALEAGMPSCAGVAVGLDRVVLLALGARAIDEVIAFPVERA
jgi:lysyl-tRNA synthetase class 2